jgi:TRAP-type uncharacterized transport system substrate-binding protein
MVKTFINPNIKKYVVIFLIFFIIYYIFYLLNHHIFKKKEIKEHYLTFFLPFYDASNTDLANFYSNNDNDKNYLKKKFNYSNLKVGTFESELFIANFLLKNFIATSYSNRSSIITYNKKMNALNDLINNKIQFCFYTYECLLYYSNILNKSIKNISLVSTLYKEYFYFITKKKYNVFSISEIPLNFKIGILNDPNTMFFYYEKFLKDLGYKKDEDYIIKIYNSIDEASADFVNDECNLLLLVDIFPKNDINNFVDNNFLEDIILLPFEIKNLDLFKKKNKYINVEYMDLNFFAKTYMPKKFSKYTYTKNKPTIKLASHRKLLLTNNDADPEITYYFIKYLYENNKSNNNNLPEIGYKVESIGLNNNNIDFLDYNKGVLKYFYEKGYITHSDDQNCINLVGTTTCDEKSLNANNLADNFIFF